MALATIEPDIEEQLNARRVARLEDIPPQSEPWLETRKLGIGGSDAAAVCGLGEFKSAYEVYVDKVGEHPDGLSIPDNQAMFWGRWLEDPIAEHTARITGCTFVKPSYLYQHADPTLSFMLANPDRLVIDPNRDDLGVCEVKTCSPWMEDRWGEEPDEPATYALMQAIHYCEVLGLRWGIIAVLIGGQNFKLYRFELDLDLAAHVVALETDFWDRVVRRDPPDPHGRGDKDLLSRMWDAVDDKKILVGDDAVEIARRYHVAKAVAKKAEDMADCAGNELRLLMGDASEAVTASGLTVATWKAQSTTKFAQKRFEAEMPRFSATYKHKEKIRVLRPKDL